MPFMQPFIYGPETIYEIETRHGTEFVPASDLGCISDHIADGETLTEDAEEFAEAAEYFKDFGTVTEIRAIPNQYFGRYSAPGYLDCTNWTIGDTADEVLAELNEMYGEEEDDEEISE